MTTANPVLTLAEAPRSRPGTAFGVLVLAWTRRLIHAWLHRRAATTLAGFDQHMLADIGLTQADIRDAVSEPLWRDPTDLLRARAQERRLTRRGLSSGFVQAPPLAPKRFPAPAGRQG